MQKFILHKGYFTKRVFEMQGNFFEQSEQPRYCALSYRLKKKDTISNQSEHLQYLFTFQHSLYSVILF